MDPGCDEACVTSIGMGMRREASRLATIRPSSRRSKAGSLFTCDDGNHDVENLRVPANRLKPLPDSFCDRLYVACSHTRILLVQAAYLYPYAVDE